MIKACIFTGLSRLLNTHIAYEIAISKITIGNLLDAGKDLSGKNCSEKLFDMVIIDRSMIVENVKILGIAEKLYIYIYIYIYIIHLTYIYSYSINTLYHSVVSKNLFVFSVFDCL